MVVMKKVKTHKFRLGKYHIKETSNGLDGCCDIPSNQLELFILEGNSCKSLYVAIHEFMHAEGIPDKYLENDGDDSAQRIGKVLWRMGWRRNNANT